MRSKPRGSESLLWISAVAVGEDARFCVWFRDAPWFRRCEWCPESALIRWAFQVESKGFRIGRWLLRRNDRITGARGERFGFALFFFDVGTGSNPL